MNFTLQISDLVAMNHLADPTDDRKDINGVWVTPDALVATNGAVMGVLWRPGTHAGKPVLVPGKAISGLRKARSTVSGFHRSTVAVAAEDSTLTFTATGFHVEMPRPRGSMFTWRHLFDFRWCKEAPPIHAATESLLRLSRCAAVLAGTPKKVHDVMVDHEYPPVGFHTTVARRATIGRSDFVAVVAEHRKPPRDCLTVPPA